MHNRYHSAVVTSCEFRLLLFWVCAGCWCDIDYGIVSGYQMSTRLHCNRKFRISVIWNDESFQRVGFCWSKRQQDSFLYGTCVGLPISIGPVDETKSGDADKGQDFKGRWAVPHRLAERLFRFWVRRTGTHTSMFRGECTRGTGTMGEYLFHESYPYGRIHQNQIR